MSKYNKPYLSYDEQLELLITRGMDVTDREIAIKYLKSIGYYRLSAYWYPFREAQNPSTRHSRSDQFRPETSFSNAVDLYVFDKKFRLLLLDAIERIEIAIRSSISHQLGKYDQLAHQNTDLLHGNFTKKISSITGKTEYVRWSGKLEALTNRSKEDFVSHYKRKYGLPLPIWVSVELWEFGMLSVFYKGMKVKDKIIIANEYGLDDFIVMESWMRTLNYIRNVCAHHSRLWNRNLIDQPKLPKHGELSTFDHVVGKPEIIARPYIVMCIILHFMATISPSSSWKERLLNLLNEFPASQIDISAMGFPNDWQHEDIWK